jgi:hypothetical protein
MIAEIAAAPAANFTLLRFVMNLMGSPFSKSPVKDP